YGSATRLLATLDLEVSAEEALPFSPALLDAAWRLSHFFAGGSLLLPFTLGRIEAAGPLPRRLLLHIQRREGGSPERQRFDMTFHDESGRVRLWLRDFTTVAAERLSDIPLQPNP